jgi:hypothetical protein
MRQAKRKGGGEMRTGRNKRNLNIAVWIASFCMIFLPNLISPLYVDASHHNLPKNKCKIVCKHRGKHGVCLVYGQDCGGNKVKKTKLYAITPGTSKDKKEEKNKSGKMSCQKNDSPHKSYTKGKHMDEDCCPDPDEWANSKCEYSIKDLSIMISKS